MRCFQKERYAIMNRMVSHPIHFLKGDVFMDRSNVQAEIGLHREEDTK